MIARTFLKRLAFAAGLAVVVFYTGNAQTPASGPASNPSNKVQRIPIPNPDFPISHPNPYRQLLGYLVQFFDISFHR